MLRRIYSQKNIFLHLVCSLALFLSLVNLATAGSNYQALAPSVILEHEYQVNYASWNTDESIVFTVSDENLRIWNAADGSIVHTFLHTDRVAGAQWSADNTRILTWTIDGMVHIWDIAKETDSLILDHDKTSVYGATWSSDESKILAWTDSDLWIWDATNGDLLFTLGQLGQSAAIWNKDNSKVLSWDSRAVRIWDASDGTELQTMRHDEQVIGAKWNSEESRVLAWSKDNTVRVWNANDGTELLVLQHDDDVQGAVWNNDESYILSWSLDGTIRVWDARDGTETLVLNHQNKLRGAVFGIIMRPEFCHGRGMGPLVYGIQPQDMRLYH